MGSAWRRSFLTNCCHPEQRRRRGTSRMEVWIHKLNCVIQDARWGPSLALGDDGKYLPPRRRFCRLRRLQPENRFAFFHQVETIARDCLQISWIRLQPANFPRCPRQQQLLLVALRLERVDLGPRRLHFLIRRNKQADDPEPDREKQKDKEYPVQSLPDGGFATSTEISIAGLIH